MRLIFRKTCLGLITVIHAFEKIFTTSIPTQEKEQPIRGPRSHAHFFHTIGFATCCKYNHIKEEKTLLVLIVISEQPYFPLRKLNWILDNDMINWARLLYILRLPFLLPLVCALKLHSRASITNNPCTLRFKDVSVYMCYFEQN